MTTTIRSNADGSKSYIAVGGTDVVTVGTQGIEAGSFKPGAIAANDFADGALIENSANGIGYGPGAGGTVTQDTSKSTAVTLNKPCGLITMNAASLAAGASIGFVLNNSLINIKDVFIVGALNSANYRVEWMYSTAGQAGIRVTNVTAGALAEALNLSFAILKGATS